MIIHTTYGDFIPNETNHEPRKKYRPSVEYYEDGGLRSVYMESVTPVRTSLGVIEAEMITFYENGAIKRLFPLYGQIGGYWTQEDEYQLAREITVPAFGKVYRCKPLCLYFYPDGALKSVTLWYRDFVTVPTAYGEVKTQFGFSLYEDGALQSVEPIYGTALETEWGLLKPYDHTHNPIHADHNSLSFDEHGRLRSARTVENHILIYEGNRLIEEYEPCLKPDLGDPEIKLRMPLELTFMEDKVRIVTDSDHTAEWDLKKYRMELAHSRSL